MTSGSVCSQSILGPFIDTYATAETYSINPVSVLGVHAFDIIHLNIYTMNFLRVHHWS